MIRESNNFQIFLFRQKKKKKKKKERFEKTIDSK